MRHAMKRLGPPGSSVVTAVAGLALCVGAQPAVATPGLCDYVLDGDRVIVALESGPFEIGDDPLGEGQRVEMEGWGHLGIPGGPGLPTR
jgi:hypothetical protein